MREQVMPFPPQPVITSDNINVSIDTVIYYQVTDPVRATYGISNPLEAIEQLAATTLRNIIGTMDMEQALTGRDQINGQLRGVLDEATGQWGIRVARVELKAIEPPRSVQGAMEQQMKAERDRRAAILTAEGVKQSAVLTAEGEKQSAILRAEGQAQSAILRAQGEARAILQVFDAIAAMPIRSCCPTSTSRPSLRSPTPIRRSSGSSRPSSRPPSTRFRGASAARPIRGTTIRRLTSTATGASPRLWPRPRSPTSTTRSPTPRGPLTWPPERSRNPDVSPAAPSTRRPKSASGPTCPPTARRAARDARTPTFPTRPRACDATGGARTARAQAGT